mmetsp:Transcript_3270/g.3241  ORF Transcript_3270/g.3241 Transcript_3270/m.3241 type:complete len:136 (-) Transcript_3270:1136-1543(-)
MLFSEVFRRKKSFELFVPFLDPLFVLRNKEEASIIIIMILLELSCFILYFFLPLLRNDVRVHQLCYAQGNGSIVFLQFDINHMHSLVFPLVGVEHDFIFVHRGYLLQRNCIQRLGGETLSMDLVFIDEKSLGVKD